MKQIATRNPDRLVFHDDWGWFYRMVGWGFVAFGALVAIGICLPKPPDESSAATRPAVATAGETGKSDAHEDPGAMLPLAIFGMAGWCLYRRVIVLDRRNRTIRIRCGVGPLSWRWRRGFDEFDRIVVRRRESMRQRQVWYRVFACGKREEFLIATIDVDNLFDSPAGATSFSAAVAAFCGYRREQGSPPTEEQLLEEME